MAGITCAIGIITAREFWDRQLGATAFETVLEEIERRLLAVIPERHESGSLVVNLKIPLAELKVSDHLFPRLVELLQKAGYQASLQTETGFDIDPGQTPALLSITTYEDLV